MKESYAKRLGKYLGDWRQDADDKAFVDEARSLELLVKMRPMKDAGQEEEINELKAEIVKLEETIKRMEDNLRY